MNNAHFFLRNKGMEKKQKVKSDRVHKNSMEEWELRLNGKKIRKQWKSAVDRIIEKSESKPRNIEFTDGKSCYDEPMKFQTNNRQRPEETRTSTEKNSRRSERLSHIEKLKLERPKSLDRGNNFGNVALGFPKKYQYYSREDILAADDEQSDDADKEVATITGSFGRETRSCKSPLLSPCPENLGAKNINTTRQKYTWVNGFTFIRVVLFSCKYRSTFKYMENFSENGT